MQAPSRSGRKRKLSERVAAAIEDEAASREEKRLANTARLARARDEALRRAEKAAKKARDDAARHKVEVVKAWHGVMQQLVSQLAQDEKEAAKEEAAKRKLLEKEEKERKAREKAVVTWLDGVLQKVVSSSPSRYCMPGWWSVLKRSGVRPTRRGWTRGSAHCTARAVRLPRAAPRRATAFESSISMDCMAGCDRCWSKNCTHGAGRSISRKSLEAASGAPHRWTRNFFAARARTWWEWAVAGCTHRLDAAASSSELRRTERLALSETFRDGS